VHGWNEFTLDVLGDAFFSVRGGVVGRLSITTGDIERIQISSGQIHLKSSRLTGNAALTPLRNRRERVLALVEWIQGRETSLQARSVFFNQEEFEIYWRIRLFPELLFKATRPPEYQVGNAEWNRADSVNWNKTYTEYLLSEDLWELRNSGALLRDWEEALPWIYMEYSWNNIISSFKETNLVIVK